MPELTIAALLAVPATGAYFADDQAAIKAGAVRDGLAYPGVPRTPGFDAIRAPAEAVSVLLILSDGHVAHGDCVSVQYAGAGGREPRLRATALAEVLERDVAPRVTGRPVTAFRASAVLVENLVAEIDGFGAAGAYGLSQALLDAAAHRAGRTMADVVAGEWGLAASDAPVPVFAQTGESAQANVDTMILKESTRSRTASSTTGRSSGPTARRSSPTCAGSASASNACRPSAAYAPVLHLDVYGMLGVVTGEDPARVADILVAMGEAAAPLVAARRAPGRRGLA